MQYKIGAVENEWGGETMKSKHQIGMTNRIT